MSCQGSFRPVGSLLMLCRTSPPCPVERPQYVMSNEVRHLATEQLPKSFRIQDFSHTFEVTNNVRIQDFSHPLEVTEKMRSDRERDKVTFLCHNERPQYVMSNEVRHLKTEQLPQVLSHSRLLTSVRSDK